MDHQSPQSTVSALTSSSSSSTTSLGNALSASPPIIRTPGDLDLPHFSPSTNPSIASSRRSSHQVSNRPRSASLSSVAASTNGPQSLAVSGAGSGQLNPFAGASSRTIPPRPGTSSGVGSSNGMASSWKSNASASSNASNPTLTVSPSSSQSATSTSIASLNPTYQERSNAFSGSTPPPIFYPERATTLNYSTPQNSNAPLTATGIGHRDYARDFIVNAPHSSSTSVTKSLSTFDVKVMAREMERNAGGGSMIDMGSDDVWQTICVRVLPLFNGEGLKMAIEDLNELVSAYTKRAMESNSLHILFSDVSELLESGMLTLSSKLSISLANYSNSAMINPISPTTTLSSPTTAEFIKHTASRAADSEKLISRLVESWIFFFGTVLPYWEGVFLPLQMEFRYGTAFKPLWRDRSLTTVEVGGLKNAQREDLDVRRMALIAFRDHVILPITDTLEPLFAASSQSNRADPVPSIISSPARKSPARKRDTPTLSQGDEDGQNHTYGRLLQMANVLASVLSHDDAQYRMDGMLASLKGRKPRPAPRSKSSNGSLSSRKAGSRDGLVILTTAA